MLLASDQRMALMREYAQPTQVSVHDMLAQLDPSVDWVLIEGFKHGDVPKIEVWRQQQDRGAMAIWSNKLVRKSFRAMQDNRIHEREQADRERQALSDYWNMQAVELLRRLVDAGSRLQGKQEKQSITIMEARRQRALVLAAKIGRKWLVKARGSLST